MKRFIHIILIFLVGSVVSCQKAPFLTFNGQKSLSFKDNGGTETITFSCNNAWTVSSSANWLKASPSQGDANEGSVKVTITCEANNTYDSRTGTVTIKSEGLSETISVSQDTNYGLMSEPTTFNLTNAAQDIEVEVKANVDYTITIDDAGKDWISQAGTKALSATKYLFGVSENTKYEGREASITFKQKDGSLCGTVKISQEQTDFLEVSPVKDSISYEGGTLKLDVITNVEYTIVAKDSPDWIKIGEGSKGETKDGLTTYSHSIEIAENESKTRYAELTVADGKGEFSKSFLITQGGAFVEFADERFKTYCVENFDTDGDGEICIEEASVVKSIQLVGCAIKSLEGIQYFTTLDTLNCAVNELEKIDISKNTSLKYLDCQWNFSPSGNSWLKTLILGNNNQLTYIECTGHALKTLDLSGCPSLKHLNCGGLNQEELELNLSKNGSLEFLDCQNNKLTKLDVSNCSALKVLYCAYNQLTNIDVSKNIALETMLCDNNKLTSLNVAENVALKDLSCSENSLTTLNVSDCAALEYLLCSNNPLSSLDLHGCSELSSLYCRDNQFTCLDVSNNLKLYYFYCDNNPNLVEIWLKTGQTIPYFLYDWHVATVYHKD